MCQVCQVCQVILEKKLYISISTIHSISNSKNHLTYRTPRTLLNNQRKNMQTNEYKVTNISRLMNKSTFAGVILAENNPEMLDKNQNLITNDKFTWYTYSPDLHPTPYTDYHMEKLGLSEADGLALINKWNAKITNSALPVINFSKIITTSGGLRFGIVQIDDPNKVIVMMNRFSGHKKLYSARLGCNGYTWQYLDVNTAPTDYQLIECFNLNKRQRDRFRKQW